MDLFAEAEKAVAEADGAVEEEEEEEEEGEPEDDFNAAWEVLDLARAIYEKQQEDDDEVKLKLAETYIYLGDVSLETGALVVLLGPWRNDKPRLLVCREVRPGYIRL